MELTRPRPFGTRRKTYFYAVAGLVLAAHVVVGAIFHVMPTEFDEPTGSGVAVEMQIVDHLLPDDVVESSAVHMVEEVEPLTPPPPPPPPPEEEEEELPVPEFEPVFEPSPVVPELEPLGPIESELPEPIFEDPEPQPEPEPIEVPVSTPEVKPASKPPVKKQLAPKPVYKKPPVKKKPAPKPASKPPVKKKVSPPTRKPAPAPAPIAKAVPVQKPPERTGLLNRPRSNKPAQRPAPAAYVQASWRKRPPPYYPYEQRKRGIEGTAHVRVSISSSGSIRSARIVKSSGNSQLDEAAVASVRKGTMNPARRGGKAVSSEMIVPFEFYR